MGSAFARPKPWPRSEAWIYNQTQWRSVEYSSYYHPCPWPYMTPRMSFVNDDVQNGCGSYQSYADTYKDGGGLIFHENGTYLRPKLSETEAELEIWHVPETHQGNQSYNMRRFDFEPADYDKCTLTYAEGSGGWYGGACVFYMTINLAVLFWGCKYLYDSEKGRKRGANWSLYQKVYLHLIIAVLCNIVATIDNGGYGGYIPYWITALAIEAGACLLHAVLYLLVTTWVAMLNNKGNRFVIPWFAYAQLYGMNFMTVIVACGMGGPGENMIGEAGSREGLYDGTMNVYKHITLGLIELLYGMYGVWQGYKIKLKIASSEGGANGKGGGAQSRKILKFLNGMCLCLAIVVVYRLTCLPRYGLMIWESPPSGPVSAMLNITAVLLVLVVAIGLHLTKPVSKKVRRSMKTSFYTNEKNRTGSTQTGNVTTDSGQSRNYKTGDTKTSNLNTADKIGRGKEDEWKPPENNSGLWPMFEDVCPIAAYTNPEVLGYLINGPAKGITNASYVFLFVALQKLANQEACGSVESYDDVFDAATNLTIRTYSYDDYDQNMLASTPCDHEPYECKEKVHGFRPASWIVNVGIIGGLVTACFLPIAGALVDFTPHRKRLGFAAIMVVNVIGLAQVFLDETNWLFMLLLQGFVATFSYNIHQIAIFAYTPELTTDLKDELPMLNATARAYELGAWLVYVALVGMLPNFLPGLELTSVDTARIGCVISTLVGGCLCVLAWSYMDARPAVQKLPEGRQATCCNIAVEGLQRLLRQTREIAKDYPQCGKFLVAYMIFESSTGAVFTLASPYLIEQLQFEGVAFFLVVTIASSIAGTQLYKAVVSRVGLKLALLQAVCYMTVLFIIFPCVIYRPEDKPWSWIFAILIGTGLGWIYPAQRTMYCSLLPGGREGEFWGLYWFCSAALSWLPNIVFVALYEAVGSMRLGFGSLILFYIIGGAMLTTVDVQRAHEDTLVTMGLRQGAWRNDDTAKSRSSRFGEEPLEEALADSDSDNDSNGDGDGNNNSEGEGDGDGDGDGDGEKLGSSTISKTQVAPAPVIEPT